VEGGNFSNFDSLKSTETRAATRRPRDADRRISAISTR